MTVKEQIKHLKTLPQDLEVWKSGKKAGTFVPLTVPVGGVAYVKPVRLAAGRHWVGDFDCGEASKTVVMM